MAVVQSPMSFEPEKPENLEKFYQYLTKETHEKIISQTKQTFSLFIPGDIISSTCTRWSGLGSANVKKISHDIYVLLNLMAKVVSLDGMGECGGHVRAKVGFTKHHLFLPNGSPKVYICAETVFEINSKRIAGYRMWWFVIDQTWSLSDGITKVMNSNIRSLDVPSKKYGKNPVNQMYDEWKNLTSPQHLTALMQSIINQCPIDTDTLNAEDSNPVEDMDFSQIINPIHASCNLDSFVPDPIQASIENYFEPYNESPAIFTGFPKIENVLLIPITNMNPINFSGAPLPRIMIDIPDYHLYLKHDARVETLRADQFQAILNVVNYYIARSGLRLEEDSPEDFNVLLQYRRVNETVHKGKIEQSKQTKDGGKALQNWRFHASESLASILTQYCRSAIPKLTKSVAGNWSWFLDLPNNQKYIGPKRLVFQDLPPIGNFVLALQETNRTICRIKGQESVGILLDLVMNAAYEYTGDTTRTKVGKPLIRLLGPPGCGKSAALSALQQVSAPYSSDRVSTQTAKWWTTDGDHSDVLTMVDEGESNAKTDPEGFRARKIIQSEEQMKQRTLVMGENGERTLVNRIIRHSGSQIQASNTRTIDDSNAMDDRSIDIKMESMGKNYGSMSDITTPTMVDISDYSHWMKVINMYMILWEKLQETNILPTVDDTMCHAIVSAVMQEMDNLEKTHPSKNGIDYNLRIRSLTQIKKLCRVMSMLTWIYTLLGTRLLDMNLDIKSIEGVFPEWSLSMLSILAYVSYIPSDAVFFTLTLYDACNLKSESVNVRVLKDIAAQTGFKSNWKKKCMAEVMKEITFYVEDNGYVFFFLLLCILNYLISKKIDTLTRNTFVYHPNLMCMKFTKSFGPS
jgi:energy-coupling factor transporter ATP-binding protein EcfA2